MLNELRDGGEARPLKTVLILPERVRDISLTYERDTHTHTHRVTVCEYMSIYWMMKCVCNRTYISILDDEVTSLIVRKDRQDILARFAMALPNEEVSLLP